MGLSRQKLFCVLFSGKTDFDLNKFICLLILSFFQYFFLIFLRPLIDNPFTNKAIFFLKELF